MQFILDLEFLSLIAKNGNFLSRTVFQAITEQEERMKDAYMVSGADLDRYVPTYYYLLKLCVMGLCMSEAGTGDWVIPNILDVI